MKSQVLQRIDPLNPHDQLAAWADSTESHRALLRQMITDHGARNAAILFGRALAVTWIEFPDEVSAAMAAKEMAAFAYAVRMLSSAN